MTEDSLAFSAQLLIKKIIHGELASIVIIVLCAAIMARGGWV